MPRRFSPSRPVSLVLAGVIVAGAGATGCTKHQRIRSNPTPELHTLYERHTDALNQVAVTRNENLRMLRQDFGRVWLMDRPSRLTPEPVPH